ncbi:MAG: 4Fe-4S ferredoxin, partial [Myxococcota bacterium]
LITLLIADLFVTLLGEFGMPHSSEVASAAARRITHGSYRHLFWQGSLLIGHFLPIALLLFAPHALTTIAAGLLVGIGLYAYEHAFVMAPQTIPNS